ncbi:MAG: hypothetical protein ACKO83_12325 [Roseiflexaceae bacterium]
MTTRNRDWVRIIGITGAVLLVVGALTMGGMFVANATGLITLPQPMRGMHGKNGMNDGMFAGGGKRHDHGDMHGRGNEMMPFDGMQSGGAQVAPEADVLLHTIAMLQHEQALATALAGASPAAKAIAATRATEIATLTAWANEWYPDATVPTSPSASGTVTDLRQLLTHHTLRIDQAGTNVTYTHAELQQWLIDALKRRATESTTLVDVQTS